MEEVADDQYEESEKEEPKEEATVPEPEEPVCKPVKKDLKEKIQCACGRWMSAHTYKYQHKCKAQTVDQANSIRAPEAQARGKHQRARHQAQQLVNRSPG